jgi:hypothetical protein
MGSPVAGCTALPVTNGAAQCTYTATSAGLTATYTGPTGLLASSTATATIALTPVITLQPLSQSVAKGSSVKLTATAAAPSTPTIQWQSSTNGTTFTSIPGATTTKYRFRPTATIYLRAVFSTGPYKAKSQAALITVS